VSKKILAVDDEVHMLVALVDLLQEKGYTVVSATNGEDALRVYQRERPDLILLDINMPKKDGREVCKEIRKEDQDTYILMLTGNQEEIDKVIGLEIGADDYIIKPYSNAELLARIKAALRRKEVKPKAKKIDQPLDFGDIHIDSKALKGYKGEREFPVSSRELQLLQLFLEHEGEVVDRDTLLEKVWGLHYIGTTRTLDQHIAKLRQKIEDDPANPQYILTVHGEGYRFHSQNK